MEAASCRLFPPVSHCKALSHTEQAAATGLLAVLDNSSKRQPHLCSPSLCPAGHQLKSEVRRASQPHPPASSTAPTFQWPAGISQEASHLGSCFCRHSVDAQPAGPQSQAYFAALPAIFNCLIYTLYLVFSRAQPPGHAVSLPSSLATALTCRLSQARACMNPSPIPCISQALGCTSCTTHFVTSRPPNAPFPMLHVIDAFPAGLVACAQEACQLHSQ